jgi:hypothetical protein
MIQSHGASAVALDKQLKATPEYLLVEEIRGFKRSISLFDGNYHQLKEQIDFFEDAQKSLHLDQAENYQEKIYFQSEIMRLLHNYVAAALSLIDHSRIHYRKLYENGTFPEYQHRVDKVFDKDPLASFVKGLRQYFQHYGLPGMYFQTSWQKDHPTFIRTIHLRNEELKEFDWKAKAREYLEAQTIDINLTLLIDAYQNKVADFYEWFQLRQDELHATEIAKVEELRAEIRRLVLPDILNATLQFPGLTAGSFEGTILPYIGYDEQIVFGLMEPESKPDFLLRVFQSTAEINSIIEEKIRALYR